MASLGEKIDDFFINGLRKAESGSIGRIRAFQIKAARFAYVVFKGFSEEQLILRAMSLVYTTLLSFVPLLAVSFSVLKAFGVHTRFMIFLYYFLEPMGESGIDLSMKIIGFVENVKIGVLGSIGLSTLVYTVISTVQKIESALNYIWSIKGTRGLSQRFSNYMSVLLVGPVLIFSAIGITTTLMSSGAVKQLVSIKLFGVLVYIITRLLPYLLITAAFTFIYIFLPNTKVRFRSALTGGIAAALLWQSIGWIFTSFIASSAQYSAIYSGFATLILFLIWLYWNFLTLLIGARVSFYAQHPQLLAAGGTGVVLSDRLRERLAIAIMFLVARNFHVNEPHWRFVSLVQKLGLPAEFIKEVLSVLEEKGLLVQTNAEPPSYMPGREPESIRLSEIIAAVRSAGEESHASSKYLTSISAVNDVMKHIEGAIALSLENKNLKDLVTSSGNYSE